MTTANILPTEKPDSKDRYLTDAGVQQLKTLATQYGFDEQSTVLLIQLTIVEQLERIMVTTRDKQRALIYGKKRKGLIKYIERFQKRIASFRVECNPTDSLASLMAFTMAYPANSAAVRFVRNQKLDSRMTALSRTIFVPDGLPAVKEMDELDTVLAAVEDLDKALEAAKTAFRAPGKRCRGNPGKDQNERLIKRLVPICEANDIKPSWKPTSGFVTFLAAYLKILGITKPTAESMAELCLRKR